MLYAMRDRENNITALFSEPADSAKEAITYDHPDVLTFISKSIKGKLHSQQRTELDLTDLTMIRVLEDLIEVLIVKNYLTVCDLPDAAQEKIIKRKNVRAQLKDAADELIPPETLGFEEYR